MITLTSHLHIIHKIFPRTRIQEHGNLYTDAQPYPSNNIQQQYAYSSNAVRAEFLKDVLDIYFNSLMFAVILYPAYCDVGSCCAIMQL